MDIRMIRDYTEIGALVQPGRIAHTRSGRSAKPADGRDFTAPIFQSL